MELNAVSDQFLTLKQEVPMSHIADPKVPYVVRSDLSFATQRRFDTSEGVQMLQRGEATRGMNTPITVDADEERLRILRAI